MDGREGRKNVVAELQDLGGARDRYERALRITAATLGPRHASFALLLNNYATVLHGLGEYPAAGQVLRFHRRTVTPAAAIGRSGTGASVVAGGAGERGSPADVLRVFVQAIEVGYVMALSDVRDGNINVEL